MRFDDRLDTALAIDSESDGGRVALWRQLVDMLAQSGGHLPDESSARALAAISLLTKYVPMEIRRFTARAIAARCDFPPLAVFLANDAPDVVVELFDRLHLDDAQWASILPDIGPLARSRLRQRSDISSVVRGYLTQFHASDFALPAAEYQVSTPADSLVYDMPDAVASEEAPGSSSIAALVERIEAYRSRPANDRARTETLSPEPLAFRADVDGQIRAIAGLPRAALVGIDMREPARPAMSGVDAGVARAFAKRDHINGGRLVLAGPVRSAWLIDASPLFDSQTGRFEGYSGSLSPAPDVFHSEERSGPSAGESRPVAEGMRQLLHELRSPLNAINGFAQLIEGQYFGPVGTHYRDLARAIIADSSILSVAFEDLDLAAKMDTGALTLEEGESDLAAMLSLLTEDAGRTIVVEGAGRPVVVAVAGRELHQLLSRLVRHLVDTTPVGATARAILRLNGFGSAELALTSIGISGDESATDLAQSGDGNAFMSLRLVERLAAHVGGSLELSAGKALLNLPCATSETGRFGTVD